MFDNITLKDITKIVLFIAMMQIAILIFLGYVIDKLNRRIK